MSTWQQLINFAVDHYDVWLAYALGSTWVVLLVQVVKKKFKLDNKLTVWRIEAKKFITLLLGVVAALAALADVILNSTGGTLLQLLPQAAAIWPWLVAGALFIHRFVVSGTWKKVSDFLQKVTDYNTSKNTPAVTPPTPPVSLE